MNPHHMQSILRYQLTASLGMAPSAHDNIKATCYCWLEQEG